MAAHPTRTLLGCCLAVVLALIAGGGASARPAEPSTSEDASYPCDYEVVGADKIFDNGNVGGVQNGAEAPTVFTVSTTHRVVQVCNYHWNDGRGATPGKIGLKNLATGVTYGPWQATGRPGMGGVPNAYWLVTTAVDIPPGKYQVTDSDPATWSQNSLSGGSGFTFVIAKPVASKPAWPRLPDALVKLEDVANGCGPDVGGNPADPRWGDTSTYRDPALKTGEITVNFRLACNLHDAGYTGAKVSSPLPPFVVRDYFRHTRAMVDAQFRRDLRQVCDRIPVKATQARTKCFDTGVRWRMWVVERAGWLAYWKRPNLDGAWVDSGNPSATGLTLLQTDRYVRGSWRGGASDPGLRGEFRGTLVNLRRGASVVKGWAMVTDASGSTRLARMEIEVHPTHGRIVVSGHRSVAGTRVRDA